MNLRDVDLHCGSVARVCFKDGYIDRILYSNVYIPVEIIREYPKFFTCMVLPHDNPLQRMGTSKPYIISLSRAGIRVGDIIVREL